jgi:hypothetical protein
MSDRADVLTPYDYFAQHVYQKKTTLDTVPIQSDAPWWTSIYALLWMPFWTP